MKKNQIDWTHYAALIGVIAGVVCAIALFVLIAKSDMVLELKILMISAMIFYIAVRSITPKDDKKVDTSAKQTGSRFKERLEKIKKDETSTS